MMGPFSRVDAQMIKYTCCLENTCGKSDRQVPSPELCRYCPSLRALPGLLPLPALGPFHTGRVALCGRAELVASASPQSGGSRDSGSPRDWTPGAACFLS